MGVYQSHAIRRKPSSFNAAGQETQERWMAQLRVQAGAGARTRCDPVYALSESFAHTFDFVGGKAAQAALGGRLEGARGTDMRPLMEENGALRRFSAYAFRNGALAAAILQGQGKLALHACLARAQGETLTRTAQSRRVLSTADSRRVPQNGSEARFGGEAHAAVALVLEATRTATQALESVRRAAELTGTQGVSTLRDLFPFLFLEEDIALARGLSGKRRAMQRTGREATPQYRAVCQALDKAQKALARKRQARAGFLQKLDLLLAHAREAQRVFELLEALQGPALDAALDGLAQESSEHAAGTQTDPGAQQRAEAAAGEERGFRA